jgi:hypothetical protein
MMGAWPVVKHQLEHDQQLNQYGQPVGAPEVKEHTTYLQYIPEGLRELASLSKSLGNLFYRC